MTIHEHPTDRPGLVRRYFDLAAGPDAEAYLAQFSPTAVVEDEARQRRGTAAIRAWRAEVPAVTYDVRAVEAAGDTVRAVARISGGFPGSPVDLSFAFDFDDDRIARLVIRP